MHTDTTRWQTPNIIEQSGHAPMGAWLTFVLQCAVCGLQHSLMEVLSEGLRGEPLQGSIPPILHLTGLLFLSSSSASASAVLEALALPVRLCLHEFNLFLMWGQGRREPSHRGVYRWFVRVVMKAFMFAKIGRGGAGRVWVQVSI